MISPVYQYGSTSEYKPSSGLNSYDELSLSSKSFRFPYDVLLSGSVADAKTTDESRSCYDELILEQARLNSAVASQVVAVPWSMSGGWEDV